MRTTASASQARRARGEESRRRLVAAASELIAERGFGATSVGDICRRAGVARTALYWHFESKEGLLAAVLEQVGRGWIEDLQKRAYRGSGPAERLGALAEGWRELLREQPELLRLLLFLQLEQGDASAAVRATLRGLFDDAARAIVAGIEDTFGVRDLPGLEQTAHTILALLQGLATYASIARDDAELDRAVEEFRRTVVLLVWSRIPDEVRRSQG